MSPLRLTLILRPKISSIALPIIWASPRGKQLKDSSTALHWMNAGCRDGLTSMILRTSTRRLCLSRRLLKRQKARNLRALPDTQSVAKNLHPARFLVCSYFDNSGFVMPALA